MATPKTKIEWAMESLVSRSVSQSIYEVVLGKIALLLVFLQVFCDQFNQVTLGGTGPKLDFLPKNGPSEGDKRGLANRPPAQLAGVGK
jgi:hypothetical protein